MSRILLTLLVASISTTVLAGEKEHTSMMYAKLAHDSDAANVKSLILKQKEQACAQNSINKHLQGDDRAHYIESCLNKNEAIEKYSAFSGKSMAVSVSDAHEELPHNHHN